LFCCCGEEGRDAGELGFFNLRLLCQPPLGLRPRIERSLEDCGGIKPELIFVPAACPSTCFKIFLGRPSASKAAMPACSMPSYTHSCYAPPGQYMYRLWESIASLEPPWNRDCVTTAAFAPLPVHPRRLEQAARPWLNADTPDHKARSEKQSHHNFLVCFDVSSHNTNGDGVQLLVI
jgi:hypothetical protein